MYWEARWLLCAFLLLGILAGGRSEPQYVLSTPITLMGGEIGKACVNLVDNNDKLDVQLIMQHDGQNTTIFEENVSAPTYFQCGDYKVPNVPKSVPVALLLSAKGEKTEILERKSVVIKPNQNNCIYQMDKPIYKPGQKVMFRIVCLNRQLKPVDEKFSKIYLVDPSNTRIQEWSDQGTERGVISRDFQLIDDAPVGSYRIVAQRESSYPLSQYFSVEEYVPPRFSVNVEAPSTVSALQKSMDLKVSAAYTFGEPVAGTVVARYCKQPGFYGRHKNCYSDKGDLCVSKTGKLDQQGSFKDTIDLSGQFMGTTGMSMQMDITVIEDGTGIQTTQSQYTWITTQPNKISFDYDAMKQHYRRQLPFPIVGKLTDEQDNPIANEDVEIETDQNHFHTVKTDADGRIYHEIDTTNMVAPNFTVQMSYKNEQQCYYAAYSDTDYPTAKYTAYRFYGKLNSFLQGMGPKGELSCGQNQNIDIQYVFSQEAIKKGATSVPIYYQVLSKSKIVYKGQQDVDLTNSMNGSTSISIPVSADMAPSANLVIYSILNGEVIVDTIDLTIEKCFQNNVDMAFTEEKGDPGSPAGVLLSGDPGSICGLKVIDSSLLLLNRYERFSRDSIYGLFYYWNYGYIIDGLDLSEPPPQCLDPNTMVFYNGNYYTPVSSKSEGDSYQKLKEIGHCFATGAHLRKPEVCDNNPPELIHPPIAFDGAVPEALSMKAADARGFGGATNSAITTLRKNFAETAMWYMVSLDKDGHASLSETFPDSITTWKGTAFCMSEKGGFGMTKYSANYTTFMPFFLDITKPYSCIRDEVLLLRGVVHNFLDQCVKVQVTLEPSSSFTAKLKHGTQDICVCSKGKAPFSWEVKSNSLWSNTFSATAQTTFIGPSCDGSNDDSQRPRVDTVVQSFVIEPEGIKQERTLSNLVFVKPGMTSTVPVTITPPNNVVPDTISAHVSAVGDIFGLIVENLQNLIRNPHGTGENNMAQVASVIQALNYLNNTGQLKDDILEKGKQIIYEGYLRQLAFANGGAYKMFRSSESTNSWVSLFTFMTLEQSKKYTMIDETRQQQTLISMENMQRLDTGCLKPQDTDDLHLTANLAIALLQTDYSLGKTLLEGAMECLKNASMTDQKMGDEVLMLYAFTLAKLPEYRNPLLSKLMKKAKVEGGTMHWEREDMTPRRPVPFFLPVYDSADVRITSYILLSLIAEISNREGGGTVKGGKLTGVTEKDLATLAQISLWLSRRQNANGVFSSALDTVVSIQALSAFAELMYTPQSEQTIAVKKNNEDVGSLNLNPTNRLLVQRKDLPDPSGDYSLEVTGNGWLLTQVTVRYNIPVMKENAAFALDISSSSDDCQEEVARSINVTISVSYQGARDASGMTIIDMRLLSGYHVDRTSLYELEEKKIISKGEEKNGQLQIYLESVGRETITMTVRLLMGETVLNVQSSSCMVYDNYNLDDNGYASYQHPCAKQE